MVVDQWHTRAARRLRERVLAEEPGCRLRLPGCTGVSTTVDHIVPRSVRPDLTMARGNCQGACASCNLKRGARLLQEVESPTALRYFG